MPDRRRVPPNSREEAQIAESILYGLIWGLLTSAGPIIREQFSYAGSHIHKTGERGSSVVYDGLTIHMASGDYEVTIRKAR